MTTHESGDWAPPRAIDEAVELWMMMQFPDTQGIEAKYRDYGNGLMIYAWRARVGEISHTLRVSRQLLSRIGTTPDKIIGFFNEKKVGNRLLNDPKEWVFVGENRVGGLALLPDTRPPKAG